MEFNTVKGSESASIECHLAGTPVVSAIIPCYGQAQYLPECIASLQQQTLTRWEAIIVDDGSPDDIESVVNELQRQESRIVFIRKRNGGLSSARNAGLAVARGAFLQFLDADDLMEPGKFAHQVSLLRAAPELDIVLGNAWYFQDQDPDNLSRGPYAKNSNHDWMTELWISPRPLADRLAERNHMPVCAPLLRRRVIEKTGYFDETMFALEDWNYWFRCAIEGVTFSFRPSEDSNVRIRMHSSSMSRDAYRMNEAYWRFWLSSVRLLRDGIMRDESFSRMLHAAALLPSKDRKEKYTIMHRLRLRPLQRLVVMASYLLGPMGPMNPLARAVAPVLPRRIKGILSSYGFTFPTTSRRLNA